jgi:hypothetical protein
MGMDGQDEQDTGLKHEQISKSIIGCAFEVINEIFIPIFYPVYPVYPCSISLRGEKDFYIRVNPLFGDV